ncbi:hypothetical protein F511_16125 [Dorcoceras hygrometricum]|uniref:Uncharacterized protein n=1 Tax=Dorcoceras hygrometricum TaxID=472368 RepID=A0A2Z7DCH8_9LAMI|nr:hypothetical protein F511_16125 [Dorcoceras hygrometricum]
MTSAVTSSFSRSYSDQQEDSADEKRCARYGMSCDDISLDVITISTDEATMDPVATQRIPVAMSLSIQSQEDSGEAFGQPVASNSSIQSRLGSQAQRIEEGAKRSSRCVKSAAKQLTYYQSWMSTAELISNGECDNLSAKEKDASTVLVSVLYRGALH